MAYADNLVFCLDSLSDLNSVIEKLEELSPDIIINKSKSAIMVTGLHGLEG
jgi:hypothetical protein